MDPITFVGLFLVALVAIWALPHFSQGEDR